MTLMKPKFIKLFIIFFLFSLAVTNYAMGGEMNITENKTESMTSNVTVIASSTETKSIISTDYLIENRLSIFSIVISCIALIQSYRFNKYRKKVDAQLGVFRKPNIKPIFYPTEKGEKEDFICNDFILAGKLPPNGGILLPLIITLTNKGEKSSKEIVFEIRYPKRLRGGGLKYTKILPGNDYSKKISPIISEETNFQTVRTEIGTLNPKQEFGINDFLTITEGNLYKRDFDATTKDGFQVTVSVEMQWGNRIDYIIYQNDDEPISGSLTIQFFDTSTQSLDDYFASYNKQQMEKYRKKFGNKFQQLLNQLKVMFSGKKNIKKIQFVYYDESKVKHIKSAKHSNITLEDVPPDALMSLLCWIDMKDCIRKYNKKS